MTSVEIDTFVENVFSREPQKRFSLAFTLDSDSGENLNPYDLANFLGAIFAKASFKLFSKPGQTSLSLSQITAENFLLLNAYFESFGFCISYEVEEGPFENTHFIQVGPGTSVSDYHIRKWNDGKTYTLKFSQL